MNIAKTNITVCIGHTQGIVLAVEDVDQVFPEKTDMNGTTLADYVLDNSPFVDDVFWGEQWDDDIPTKPGIYMFSGELHFDSEGDWEISGSFGDPVWDLSHLEKTGSLIA